MTVRARAAGRIPWVWLALALLAWAAAALRAWHIRRQGLWWDEVAVWHAALTGVHSPQEAPLNTWLARGAMVLLGRDDAYALHVATIALGTATVPAAYLLGEALGDRRRGLLCALLVAISPVLVAFSREARPYPLLILLTTLQLGLAARLLRAWSGRELLLLVLTSVAALMTHLVALPFTIGIGAVLVGAALTGGTRREVAWRVGQVLGGGAIALAAGLWWTRSRPSFDVVMTGRYQFGLGPFVRYILTQCGPGHHPVNAPWDHVDQIAAGFSALALLGVGALVAARRAAGASLMLLPALAVAGGLYLRLGEKSVWPWFRYATPVVVPFLALVATGVTFSRRLWVTAGLLVALLATHLCTHSGLRAFARDADVVRGAEWKAGVAALEAATPPFVGVVFAPQRSVFGDESDRLISSYALWRTRELPAYYAPWYEPLVEIEWRRVVGQKAVPVRTSRRAGELAKGRYAVFLGWDSYRQCGFLSPAFSDPDPRVEAGLFIPCIVK